MNLSICVRVSEQFNLYPGQRASCWPSAAARRSAPRTALSRLPWLSSGWEPRWGRRPTPCRRDWGRRPAGSPARPRWGSPTHPRRRSPEPQVGTERASRCRQPQPDSRMDRSPRCQRPRYLRRKTRKQDCRSLDIEDFIITNYDVRFIHSTLY